MLNPFNSQKFANKLAQVTEIVTFVTFLENSLE